MDLVLVTSRAALVDALCRAGYRAAFRALRLWWRWRRPSHRGAIVALWHDGRVLMLRQSYRDTLEFPGGGIAAGEGAAAAACRELAKETGLAVGVARLTHVRDMVAWCDYRDDHVAVFELKFKDEPEIRIDNREIVDSCFMHPAVALAHPLSPFVRGYLESAAVR
jgi:8-oxo-dGTP pyrophosphatase MutT (NUDIX family)